jgi:transcriptional regulator with XRE-family HTH domain
MFNQSLYELMSQAQYTKEELSKDTRISQDRVDQLLSGTHRPTIDEVLSIMDALYVDFEDLFGVELHFNDQRERFYAFRSN